MWIAEDVLDGTTPPPPPSTTFPQFHQKLLICSLYSGGTLPNGSSVIHYSNLGRIGMLMCESGILTTNLNRSFYNNFVGLELVEEQLIQVKSKEEKLTRFSF